MCRGLSEAKKAFLYDTSVELGEAEDGGTAEDAAATKVLSQMKQLELSGTAGNILLPTDEAAEVGSSILCHKKLSSTAHGRRVIGWPHIITGVSRSGLNSILRDCYIPPTKVQGRNGIAVEQQGAWA